MFFSINSIFILIILSSNYSPTKCNRIINYVEDQYGPIENDLKQFWTKISNNFDDYFRKYGIEEMWNSVKDNVSTKIEPKCFKTVDSLVKNWFEKESSTRMFVSTGFSPISTGILDSTTVEFGDFDSCLRINDDWQGQYCMATINIPRSKLFHLKNISSIIDSKPKWKTELLQKWYEFDNHYSLARGFCSPSHCKPNDIRTILQTIFPTLNSIDFKVQFCQTSTNRPLNSKIWIPAVILVISILLGIFGTLYNRLLNTGNGKLDDCIRSFDIIDNFQKLFNLDEPKNLSNRTRFDCFDGIRVIFTIMVVIAHVSMGGQIAQMKTLQFAHFPRVIQERIHDIPTLIFGQPHILIGFFMLMSSILLSYTGLQKNSLRESFLVYAVRRYARYMPTMIGCMCVFLLFEIAGDGPLFHHDNFKYQTDKCYDYWWRNLLMIQNMYGLDTTCIQPAWFIATEFQLRILSFFLLLLYSKYSTKITNLAVIGYILIGIVGRIIVLYSFDVTPNIFVQLFPEYSFYPTFFVFVHTFITQYIGVYAIGFTIGLFLREKKKFEFSITKNVICIVLVTLSFAYNGAHIYDGVINKQLDVRSSFIQNVASSFSILFFNLSAGYFIYYVISHPSGSISQFLSHRFFLPYSKLSFCVYLIHMPVLVFNFHQVRAPIPYDTINLINQMLFPVMVESVFVSIFLHIFFEAPWDRVVKIFKTKKAPEKEAPKDNKEIEEKKEVFIPLDSNDNHH